MTKDVIELAREAGICSWVKPPQETVDAWGRFAAIVAAQMKERCAQLCESEWSNIAEKMYGAQLATAIRALNTEGDGHDRS
jgi:CxxC motif-containing protein (DUF1111 family)